MLMPMLHNTTLSIGNDYPTIVTVKFFNIFDKGITIKMIYFLGIPVWKSVTAFDIN